MSSCSFPQLSRPVYATRSKKMGVARWEAPVQTSSNIADTRYSHLAPQSVVKAPVEGSWRHGWDSREAAVMR